MMSSQIRCARLALLCFSVGIGAASAQPCSLAGEFQPFSPAFRSPAGTAGVLVQSSTLFIDSDQDGMVGPGDPGDKSFPVPAELRSPNPAAINLRLSPTQDFLFAAGGALNGCASAGQRVRIYSVPVLSGQPLELIFEDCLPCSPNDGGAPLWYDQGITQGGASGQPPAPNASVLSTRRLAYIRTNASSASCGFGQPQLRFYDLVARESATFDLGLLPGTGVSLVSPGGEYMIFQHDLTNNPADSDVLVLSLCDITPLNTIVGSPPSLNDASIPGIRARVAGSGSGSATIEILNGSSQVVWTGVPACCSGGLPPLGSCCVNNNCSVTAQADCAGVWMAGGTCVNTTCVPSAPDPQPALNAPTPVTVGQGITVPVSVTNLGQSTASGITVTLSWTYSQAFTFVSASNGGAPSPAGSATTRWTIPSLASGATVNLTANLSTGCFAGDHTFRVVVTATGIASREASQAVHVDSRPVTPIDVLLVSVPAQAAPLVPGDLITHTLTMSNTGVLPTPVFALSTFGVGIAAGQGAEFAGITDCGGGTVCELVNQDFVFNWSGVLSAGQTRTVVFTTRIRDCFDPAFPFTSLGLGQSIYAIASCSEVLGVSNAPDSIGTAPALDAQIRAINVQPGIIGQPSSPSSGGVTVQVVEGAPELALRISFTNRLAVSLDLGAISIPIPVGWAITTQPTNGAAYDGNTGEVTFTGVLAPHGSISFDVGVQPDVIDASNSTLSINRQTALCGRAVGSLRLFNAPALPSGPFVLSTNRFFGAPVTIIERGVDSSPRDFLTSGGAWNGIATSDAGDLWFIGDPLTMFNPHTLAYEQYAEVNAFAQSLSEPCELVDGGVQASTGDIILYARASASAAAVDVLLRFEPGTRAISVVAQVPRSVDAQRLSEVWIDSAGDILFCNHDQLLRYPGARGPQLPPNSGVPIAVPGPAYSDPNYGTLTTQRVWTFAPLCDGTFAILHASEFVNPVGLEFYDRARVFALSVFDPAAGSIHIVDGLLAGEAGSGGSWSAGASLAPAFQVSHPYPFEAGGISMVQGEPGEVITGNDAYMAFHTAAINLTTGEVTYMQDPHQFGFKSALDIAYLQPASADCSPACVGDFNRDGGIDGADVQDFFAAWENGDPSGDVNADGGVDGSDVDYFFERWEQGC